MPEAWDSGEGVKLVASVIDTNRLHLCRTACVAHLFICQRVMVMPGPFELVKVLAISYSHPGPFWKLCVVKTSCSTHLYCERRL